MPCFRGIEVAIVAAADGSTFPEFPHPDGSSARFGGLNDTKHGSAVFQSPRPRPRPRQPDAKAPDDGVRGPADPRISVYIPSAPETNFFFRYGLGPAPPAGCKYLFFRVAMNGRHAVSWGADLAAAAQGSAHQALFAPSAYYQHNDHGVVFTEHGIESRCFRFVSCGAPAASAADDGGLIEVQVFRARARHRRAPQPPPYRGGDKYGIALISNGLLERPHLASYYDYHLVDAKDAPYASFRFHYRSWASLRSLQLAPDERPDFLCASPPSEHADPQTSTCSSSGSAGAEERPRRLPRPCDDLPDAMGFDFAFCSQDPRSTVAAGYRGRPLPALPTGPGAHYGRGEDGNATGRARTEEQDTAVGGDGLRARGLSAVSVAPSLQAYADGEEGVAVDTMELGSATRISAVFHGRPAGPAPIENGPGRGLVAAAPGDDIFCCAGAANCGLPDDLESPGVPGTAPLRLFRTRSRSNLLFTAPFTDSLRKRNSAAAASAPQSPITQHRRGISDDYSIRSRGSPTPRRLQGGSLDSRSRLR